MGGVDLRIHTSVSCALSQARVRQVVYKRFFVTYIRCFSKTAFADAWQPCNGAVQLLDRFQSIETQVQE